jgi:hypothetical protein
MVPVLRHPGEPVFAVMGCQLPLQERNQPRFEQFQGFANTFVIGDSHGLLPSQKICLVNTLPQPLGQAGNLGPALHQAIIGQPFGGPFLPFTEGIEAVGQLPGGIGPAPQFGRQGCRRPLPLLQGPQQLVYHLPDG